MRTGADGRVCIYREQTEREGSPPSRAGDTAKTRGANTGQTVRDVRLFDIRRLCRPEDSLCARRRRGDSPLPTEN